MSPSQKSAFHLMCNDDKKNLLVRQLKMKQNIFSFLKCSFLRHLEFQYGHNKESKQIRFASNGSSGFFETAAL